MKQEGSFPDFSCVIHENGNAKEESEDQEKNGQKNGEISSKNENKEVEQNVRMGFLSIKKCVPSSRKILLVFFLCAIFFCCGGLVTHLAQNVHEFFPSSSSSSFQNSSSQNAGENHSCSSLSGKISVDVDLDPCDDFYEFACGILAKDKKDQDTKVDERFSQTLQLILGFGDTENEAEENAQNFYKSCVNAAANPESILLNTELDKMKEKLMKIPPGNLQKKLELIQIEYGFSPFFTWEVGPDDTASDLSVMQINSKWDGKSPHLENFTNLLKSSQRIRNLMVKILGNPLNFTEKFNDSDFEQLVKLEMEIQELSLVDGSETKSESDSSMNLNLHLSLDQLENLAGFVNWKKFVDPEPVPASLYFDWMIHKMLHELKDPKVVVWCPQCLSKVSEKLNHLANSTAENQKLLDKFLMWQAGKEILDQLFKAGDISAFAATTCSSLTSKYFPLHVAAMHRRHVLKEHPDLETTTTNMVQEMAENIREKLILVLKEAEWLDEKSREKAIKKARDIQVVVGYPETVKSSESLKNVDQHFPKMSETDFVRNIMDLFKHHRLQKSIFLTMPKNVLTQDVLASSGPLDNNAYSFASVNIILIPVQNLLPPNLPAKSLGSFDYGRIGFTIAHEFFHNFYFGSNWNRDKNLQMPNQNQNPNQNHGLWETEETREEMENRSSCLIRQYSKFSYPDGKSLSGAQTISENFADNGGLDVVTRAFSRLIEEKNMKFINTGEKDGKKEILEDKKLFFTSFAQRWCTDEPPKFINDPHAPHKFRVLGALQNSKAFSEAFNCPLKSGMNPQEKCTLF